MRPHLFQLFFECILLATKQAAVNLDLLFALSTLLHAALLTGKMCPLACQARQVVLDLRQLDLQASFSRRRTLAEDNEPDLPRGTYTCLPLTTYLPVATLSEQIRESP